MSFSVRVCALALWIARVFILSVIGFVLAIVAVSAETPSGVSDLAARINRERISRGLVPYALNAQLSIAAQAHADDLSRTGRLSHIGSDGSTVFDRVARTRYGAYSWGRRLGENWAWFRDPATAMQMWMGSPPHRANILHAVYREFGIGIAPANNGGFLYVVVFGAQPNVLPIFIQNGASDTASNNVTIVLSNEDYATNGDGANTIGKASQVEVSNSPNYAGAQWQPFVPRFAWTLPPGGGTKSVYVKFRDTRGRTVTSSDSINASASFTADSTATPLPTAKPTQTLRPSPMSTKPKPTLPPPTSQPPATLAPETTTISIPTLTLTPEPTPTETPLPAPTATLEVAITPDQVSVAMIAGETPAGMIDSQEEMLSEQPLQPDTPFRGEDLVQSQVTPIAFMLLGTSVLLSVLAIVKWMSHRAEPDD